MNIDPALPQAVGIISIVLLVGFILRLIKQPHVVAYLITGILIGPWGIELIQDVDIINRLGAIGVVLLLFYAGMETDIQQLAKNWKLAIFGTLIQILLSVFFSLVNCSMGGLAFAKDCSHRFCYQHEQFHDYY